MKQESKEKIEEIDLSLIDDFKEHPFKVIENEELIKKIENKAEQVIKNELQDPKANYNSLKSSISEQLYPFINELTGRKPIILPIILDIKR